MPLLDALADEVRARVQDTLWVRDATFETLVNFMHFILAVAWSFAFLRYLTHEMRLLFRQRLRALAAEADLRAAEAGRSGRIGGRGCSSPLALTTAPDLGAIQTRSGVRPSLLVDLSGMVVVHKPADWEVDGIAATEGGHAHPPLSSFLQSLFPLETFPLVWSAGHGYGFLHRLDIPSSGLVLGGTSFEGYYWLRLQLDTHLLRREYVVVCSGLAPTSLEEVAVRVDMAPEPTQRRSVSDSGKPSQTWVRVQAHVGADLIDSDIDHDRRACVTAIRILTGRRHQIRVHMRHAGHPTLADARYTCRELFMLPLPAAPSLAVPASLALDARAPTSAGGSGSGGSFGGTRRWTYNAPVGRHGP